MSSKKSLVFLTLLQLSLFSATFDVNTTSELRDALENATLMDENITIILSKNIYNTENDSMGTFVYKGQNNLTIECKSKNRHECILDGNKKDRVLYFDGHIKVILKNLTIRNGRTTDQRGGGVFLKNGYNLTATNVDFINNYLNGTDNDAKGGAIYAESVYIDNCNFENNTAYKDNDGNGGAIYARGGIIKNSTFKNNISKGIYSDSGFGGAIYIKGSDFDTIIISNNKFYNNIAQCNFNTYSKYSKCGTGGAIYIDMYDDYGQILATNSIIVNNLFIENKSTNPGSAIVTNIPLINNTIVDNKGGQSVVAKKTVLVNNLFLNNSKDLLVEGDNIVNNNYIYLYNNIIDMSKISGIENIYKLNNIQSSQEVLFNDNLYTLQSNSLGIDSGLNPTNKNFIKLFDKNTYDVILNYLKTDYFGNKRIINNKIDIGASEYRATAFNKNKPKIDIKFSGDQKVYSTITVNIDINTSNTISELEIDKGEGYQTVSTTLKSFNVSYNSPGEYTIKVKVIDDQDNTAELAKNITIYDLTTQEAIEYGKQLCQKDPNSCGIGKNSTSQDILDNQKLTNNISGWRLLGSNKDLIPSEIFNKNPKVSIIWVYRGRKWYAKGENSKINVAISNNKNISTLNTIENGDGFWIYVKP